MNLKEQHNQYLLAQNKHNESVYKQLFAIIKAPRLCSEFHKAMRSKVYTAKALEQSEINVANYIKSVMDTYPSE